MCIFNFLENNLSFFQQLLGIVLCLYVYACMYVCVFRFFNSSSASCCACMCMYVCMYVCLSLFQQLLGIMLCLYVYVYMYVSCMCVSRFFHSSSASCCTCMCVSACICVCVYVHIHYAPPLSLNVVRHNFWSPPPSQQLLCVCSVCTCTCTCIHARMRIHTYIHIYIYIYIYIYYAYVYLHNIHTYVSIMTHSARCAAKCTHTKHRYTYAHPPKIILTMHCCCVGGFVRTHMCAECVRAYMHMHMHISIEGQLSDTHACMYAHA